MFRSHDAWDPPSVCDAVFVPGAPSTSARPVSSAAVALRARENSKRADVARLESLRARGIDDLRILKPFLVLLPVEVQLALFRGTSSRPRNKHWQKYVDVETTLRVCRLGGPLSTVARRSVPALAVSDGGRIPHAGCIGLARSKLDPRAIEVFAYGVDKQNTFKELLQQVAPGLESLALFFSNFWARDIRFEEHCLNLTSLTVYDRFTELNLPPILEACSGKMRSLDLGAAFLPPRYIDAIADHCAGLEKLTLKYGEIGASLLPMWETVGPTLKEFTFGRPAPVGPYEYPEVTFLNYEDITKKCVVLRAFGIENIGYGTVPISAIKALGDKLEVLRMMGSRSCLSPEALKMIFEDCPNVKVEAFVESKRVAALRSLNYRLSSLKLNYDALEEGIEEVARECINVETLDFIVRPVYTEYVLSCFLAPDMTQLRCLSIEVVGYYGLDEGNKLFDVVASKVTTIEKVSCYVDYISVGTFSLFAAKNKNIRCVNVVCGRRSIPHGELHYNDRRQKHDSLVEDAAVSFVQDFARCEYLEELILDNQLLCGKKKMKKVDRIQNVIKDYKIGKRSIDVFIGGIQYNP